VNGTELEHGGSGWYNGRVPSDLSPGDLLNLQVIVEDATVTAAGAVPSAAHVITPETGSTFSAGESVTVSWSSPTDPDRFAILVTWEHEATGHLRGYDVEDGAVREQVISLAGLPLATPINIEVSAYDDGTFSGPNDTEYDSPALPGLIEERRRRAKDLPGNCGERPVVPAIARLRRSCLSTRRSSRRWCREAR
jgi:hypothetical protein